MPEKNQENVLICCACDIPLEVGKVHFSYLGHNFSHDLPRCSQCGQVFITEDLVRGKMMSVETTLEDK